MEVVTCYCIKCKAELGRFRNSWNGIGNTYFTPVHAALSLRGLAPTGEVHAAASGSHVENSFLQDLACHKCRAVLGLRCDSSPEGHLLQRDQLILRLSEMSVISEGSGRTAKISVLETFALKSAHSKLSVSRRASTAQPSAARPLPPKARPSSFSTQGVSGKSSLHSETTRKPLNSSRMSIHPDTTQQLPTTSRSQPQLGVIRRVSLNDSRSGVDDSNAELNSLKIWANETISGQKQDIERISGAVERIEGDLRKLNDFVQEIRKELASNRHVQQNKNGDYQLAIRKEIGQLKSRLKDNESRQTQRDIPTANLINEKFETIAENVVRIDKKAHELDGLKTILEQLTERVHHLENATEHPAIHPAPSMKRKHDQEREIRTPSPGKQSLELPSKRRKVTSQASKSTLQENSDGKSLKQPKSQKRQVIDLVSSDALSPILGSEDYTAPIFDELLDSRVREKRSPRVIVYVSTQNTSTEEFRKRTSSRHSGVAPASEPKASRESNMIEVEKRRRSDILGLRNKEVPAYEVKDLAFGRKRDSVGRLIREDGQIDRRSLRSLRQAKEKPSNEAATSKAPSTREEEPIVIASVEQNDKTTSTTYPWKCDTCSEEFQTKVSFASHQNHCNSTYASSIANHGHSCQACGKTWKSRERYMEHKCSQQQDAAGAKETEAETRAKQAKLLARERLVRETLERELC